MFVSRISDLFPARVSAYASRLIVCQTRLNRILPGRLAIALEYQRNYKCIVTIRHPFGLCRFRLTRNVTLITC